MYPSNDLFIKHKVLKFKDMVKEQSIIIILVFINNDLPNPIAGILTREPVTSTRHPKLDIVPSVAEWSKALESDASAGSESPVRAPVRAATLCPYA